MPTRRLPDTIRTTPLQGGDGRALMPHFSTYLCWYVWFKLNVADGLLSLPPPHRRQALPPGMPTHSLLVANSLTPWFPGHSGLYSSLYTGLWYQVRGTPLLNCPTHPRLIPSLPSLCLPHTLRWFWTDTTCLNTTRFTVADCGGATHLGALVRGLCRRTTPRRGSDMNVPVRTPPSSETLPTSGDDTYRWRRPSF